ncbi:MAG: hypothetical protein Q9M09_05240 [Mariprofundaceae bacterium]|nr:hypothetical protein [Mariprofundaceae bacterium]
MNFHAYAAFFLVLVGLCLNWLVPATINQPDWGFALLLGALLAQWRYIWWVLPWACLHDLVLYWTLWPSIFVWLSLPLLLIWLDALAGAGLPQRMLLLLLAHGVLLGLGWSLPSLILTLLLSVWCWYGWIALGDHLHSRRQWQP